MLIKILSEHDDEARIERSLEPEWLVAKTLFAVCHEGMESGPPVSEILVGGLTGKINQRLLIQGEDIKLGAKKVGLVLKSLGVRTVPLGRLGRGLKITTVLKRKIHEIAAQLGIDRRAFATLPGLEAGYGGAPCPLCKKFGITGGLRLAKITKSPLRRHPPSERISFFDQKVEDSENYPLRPGTG